MATGKALSSVADVAAADGTANADTTYSANEQTAINAAVTLANETKAQFNALLAEMRDRGWLDR